MEKQRETLKNFRPEYDIDGDRMLYPTEMANGTVAYLPLAKDASNRERAQGLYAALVPLEPLEVFLEREDVIAQDFDLADGKVQAYALADIEAAFERAPQLVLRAAQIVSDVAREVPGLQRQPSEI